MGNQRDSPNPVDIGIQLWRLRDDFFNVTFDGMSFFIGATWRESSRQAGEESSSEERALTEC